MLKGIDPRVTPDLMDALMRMGHGDEIVIADANFPAHATAAHCHVPEPIHLPAMDAVEAAELICTLLPLEAFFDYCALRMQIDGAPDELGEVHTQVFAVLEREKPDGAILSSLERQDFYAQAKQAFAVVATNEARPFGCFILRKGVIF
ncbi:MAG: RbsD/FucU domain-containing protein [Roseitalea porphyridii]|jgi:L-fucose mutarotase|uniref:RbsD/FucU family protein n=1 Tax=Roseitalea porphyridii TaxID=1852022 RepID=UPI0032ECE553